MGLRSCVVEVVRVNDNAMAPAVKIGELVLVNKLSYGIRVPGAGEYFIRWGEPQLGDLVLASEWGDPPLQALRRVVFPPSDGAVLVSGEDVRSKADEYGLGLRAPDGKVALYHGPARMRNIAGKAIYVLLPKEKTVSSWWSSIR